MRAVGSRTTWLLLVALLAQACGSDSKTGPSGATQIKLTLQGVSRAQIPPECTGVLLVTGGEGLPVSATVPPDGVVRLLLTPGPHTFTVTLICDGRIFTGRQDADVVSGQPLNLTMRVTVSDVCAQQPQPRKRRGEQGGRGLAYLEPLWPDALRRVVGLARWADRGARGFAVSPASGVMVAQVPTPTISTIVPDFAFPGSGAFTLTVVSSGFDYISTSTVNWNGAARTTTFINATQLTASIPASDVMSAGTASVTVVNPGAPTSNAVTFNITTTPPTPVLFSLTPAFAAPGGPGFSMVVTGNNFVTAPYTPSVVQWNGASRPTSFINVTQVSASIPASDIAAPGTATVTVLNPGGGTSNALTFTVTGTSPIPVIFSLSPPSATAGGEAFTMTVTGQNFFSGATVQWNGSDRPTAFENSTQLRAAISAADVANPATAQVTVVNPPPGGGTSNALSFTVCARGR